MVNGNFGMEKHFLPLLKLMLAKSYFLIIDLLSIET
jgi:hypothetical protein